MPRASWCTVATRALLWAPALSVCACLSPVDAPGSTVPPSCQAQAPLVAPQMTDLLFVIDDSASMAEEQAGVAAELPAFVEALREGGGAAHDFQVGVVTTSVYQKAEVGGQVYYDEFPLSAGRLVEVPSSKERILRWDDPDLVEKFAELIQRGTTGSGQETPFEAARVATQEGVNPGFLRDGARLLVVVVTDEDDCSETDRPPEVTVGTDSAKDYCGEAADLLTPVDDYVDYFRGLKDGQGATREVLWAAIAPVAVDTLEARAVVDNGILRNVGCPTSFGPGRRHRALAQAFDETLGNLGSICSASYREDLLEIAQIANAWQSAEVENVPDPRLLKVELTREDGAVEVCTVQNGGISWDGPPEGGTGRILFTGQCPRRASDLEVSVKMLCAG